MEENDSAMTLVDQANTTSLSNKLFNKSSNPTNNTNANSVTNMGVGSSRARAMLGNLHQQSTTTTIIENQNGNKKLTALHRSMSFPPKDILDENSNQNLVEVAATATSVSGGLMTIVDEGSNWSQTGAFEPNSNSNHSYNPYQQQPPLESLLSQVDCMLGENVQPVNRSLFHQISNPNPQSYNPKNTNKQYNTNVHTTTATSNKSAPKVILKSSAPIATIPNQPNKPVAHTSNHHQSSSSSTTSSLSSSSSDAMTIAQHQHRSKSTTSPTIPSNSPNRLGLGASSTRQLSLPSSSSSSNTIASTTSIMSSCCFQLEGRVSCLTATRDGAYVVAGFSTGIIKIFSMCDRTTDIDPEDR